MLNKEFSAEFAVIGGSGFYHLDDSQEPEVRLIPTPYSATPVALYGYSIVNNTETANTGTSKIWFLPRHGKEHTIPPHLINYRANLWALNELGVKRIIAVNAVGGIHQDFNPGCLLTPDQILDFTWGREHTFFDGLSSLSNHIDFTWPYDRNLNNVIYQSAQELGISLRTSGVYACTQGPRLESAAEVKKLRNDGADIVGMTGMPEAALARELEISYSSIAIVVNWTAGITTETISMDEIIAVLNSSVSDIRKIVLRSFQAAPIIHSSDYSSEPGSK